MLSERNQTQKATCGIMPFIYMKYSDRQIQRDRKYISSCQGLTEEGTRSKHICFGGNKMFNN